MSLASNNLYPKEDDDLEEGEIHHNDFSDRKYRYKWGFIPRIDFGPDFWGHVKVLVYRFYCVKVRKKSKLAINFVPLIIALAFALGQTASNFGRKGISDWTEIEPYNEEYFTGPMFFRNETSYPPHWDTRVKAEADSNQGKFSSGGDSNKSPIDWDLSLPKGSPDTALPSLQMLYFCEIESGGNSIESQGECDALASKIVSIFNSNNAAQHGKGNWKPKWKLRKQRIVGAGISNQKEMEKEALINYRKVFCSIQFKDNYRYILSTPGNYLPDSSDKDWLNKQHVLKRSHMYASNVTWSKYTITGFALMQRIVNSVLRESSGQADANLLKGKDRQMPQRMWNTLVEEYDWTGTFFMLMFVTIGFVKGIFKLLGVLRCQAARW